MTLQELNQLPAEEAWRALERCCGASVWVDYVCEHRPYADRAALDRASKRAFDDLEDDDWIEAFSHHPMIGDVEGLRRRFAGTAAWAGEEQRGVTEASEATLKALADANRTYLERFGWIFVVCATGQSADAMLATLRKRIGNDAQEEMRIAAGEQRKITRIRLDKMLAA